MPVSLKDFAKSLANSGLMSAEEVRDFLGSFPPEKQPKSTQDLARELLRAGKITKYQAMEVYHGRTKGLVLGNYVILGKIGAGGMGQVYEAQHRRMKRTVAIKVLPPAAMKSEPSIQRFQREVEAAAKLEHPNIVTAHDADESGGIHFLVMQHVDGSDLSHIVSERGPLPVETAVDCIIQAAKGLEYAHKQGVIHRDIKPANLLVDREGTVKILDMGLARVFEAEDAPEDRLTDSGQVMGTCDYMAPEQAEDTRTADHRADIYSLGCTLYRILTGKKPYTGDSLIKVLLAHREAPVPSLCEEHPDVPASLETAYQKMMAKTPENRYQSMTDVIVDLEACVSKERQPVVGEASSDSALTAFLQNISEGGVAVQKKAAKVAAETVPSQADVETGIWRKIVPVDRRQRKLFAGIAAGSAMLVVLLGVVLMLRTPDGTLVVEIEEDDVLVKVLDEEGKIEIERKGKKGELSISVDPGKHRLKVEKDGFSIFTEGFEIESGGKVAVKATLKPLEKEKKVTASRVPEVASFAGDWALEFDGTDDYVHVPTLDCDGTHPLTIEAFAKPHGIPSSSPRGGHYWIVATPGCGVSLFVVGKPTWRVKVLTSDPDAPQYDAIYPLEDEDTVTHVAAVFDGKRVRLYANGSTNGKITLFPEDGTKIRQLPPDKAISGKMLFTPDHGIYLGQSAIRRFGNNFFHGIINEVRISNIARYTEDFTPQKRFEPDQHTMALYHFDEGSGDVLKDSSGNGHDGKIVGAKWVKVDEGLGVVADDPDRRAAEWVLGIGGRIAVLVGGQNRSIEVKGDLPSETFLLRSILLENNSIVSDDGLTNLEGVTGLYALHLTATRVGDDGLRFLQDLTHLRELGLRATDVGDEGLKYLNTMTSLGSLHLMSTRVTDAGMQHLSSLQTLKRLYLNETQIGDAGIQHLASLTSLLSLELGGTQVTPAGVANLQAALPNCKIITDSSEEESIPDDSGAASHDPERRVAEWVLGIGGTLEVSSGGGVLEGIASVSDLPQESFAVRAILLQSNMRVEDAHLERLKGLTSLEHLFLDKTAVSDAGVAHVEALTALRGLALGRTSVGDAGLKHIGHVKTLRSLVLSVTEVTDAGLQHLEGLTELKHLLLVGTQITDAGLQHLKALKNLTRLVLDDTKVTPAGVADLQAALPNCEVILDSEGAPDDASMMPSTQPPPALAPFTPEEAKQHRQAWADHLSVPVEFSNSIGMKMVLIPPGEFLMGSPDSDERTSDREKPQHRVRMTKPFYVAAHEVTVGQFRAFAEDSDYETKAETSGDGGWGYSRVADELKWGQEPEFNWRNLGIKQTDQHPVVNVAWRDAVALCEWLSRKEGKTYRLPTEAQWEYSCRAGSTTQWSFGDDETELEQYAWYKGTGRISEPVGRKLPNALGLYDMHGNVSEWCLDLASDDYSESTHETDPEGPARGNGRMVRGGTYVDDPWKVRSAYRLGYPSHFARLYIGFRLVLLLDPAEPPRPTS